MAITIHDNRFAFPAMTEAGGDVPHQTIRFSGGEIHVRIDEKYQLISTVYRIVAHLVSANDVMELIMVTDALRRKFGDHIKINLTAPYFPYARQDRVCNPGEAHGARVMCDLINAQNYHSVEIWDAHSDVVPACLDRCINVHQSEFVKNIVDVKNMVLIAPDAGAAKKTAECAKLVGARMYTASKKRDTATGAITGTEIFMSDHGNIDILMVDDICDGGRTFTELAKVLRPKTHGRILLYVTHGIFSKGMGVFDGLIDHIYCANPFPAGVTSLTKVARI